MSIADHAKVITMNSLPFRGWSALALAAWMTAGAFTGAAAQGRESAAAPVEGFYVGAFAGALVAQSKVTIEGNGTQSSASLQDSGAVLGLRGGWGMRLTPGLYTGLELEGMFPIDVNSRYSALGQTYRREINSEIGAYARLGWSPDGQSLLFLRGGAATPLNANTTTLIGVVGVGAEMPIAQRLAGRVDVSYSFPYTRNQVEIYRMTAGLVLRF